MTKGSIVAEARRIEEDLLWASAAHFQVATVWRATHWMLGIPTVALTAATGVASVKESHPSVVVACAFVSMVLSALQTFLNPQKAAKDAHAAGVRANVLMARVRRFHEIDLQGPEMPKDARAALERLAEEKAHLLETTPHTGGLAYWLARRSVGRRQHVHVVDAGKPDRTVVT